MLLFLSVLAIILASLPIAGFLAVLPHIRLDLVSSERRDQDLLILRTSFWTIASYIPGLRSIVQSPADFDFTFDLGSSSGMLNKAVRPTGSPVRVFPSGSADLVLAWIMRGACSAHVPDAYRDLPPLVYELTVYVNGGRRRTFRFGVAKSAEGTVRFVVY